MGHSWPAITETVHLLLRPFDDMGWEAEADFVLDEGLPFALLGYEGFLNRWAVSFNGAYGYFVVEPAGDLDARLPAGCSEIAGEVDAWLTQRLGLPRPAYVSRNSGSGISSE